MKNKLVLLLLFLLLYVGCFAKIILPNILSDNMVLQQNSSIRLWGKAVPNTNVEIIVDWNKEKVVVKSDNNGSWETTIKTISGSYSPYSITFSNSGEYKTLQNILLGEVWICSGQSNMEMPLKGFRSQPVNGALDAIIDSENYNQIRMFTAPKTKSDKKEFDVNGKWQEASINSTFDFSAVGYFYARELCKVLNVPIGMIHISWGGSNVQAWMSLENLKMFPEFNVSQIDMKSKSPMRIPTALYNGMFYPVSKYNIKGVIWYQGESNIGEAELYKKMFPAMVKEWRTNIGLGEIPFNYVQIAPYRYNGSDNVTSPLIREAQLECLELIPNTEMVVTMDIGDENLIHPAEKETIGKRLAYITLAKNYGFDKIPYASPIYLSKEIKGNKIILTFKNQENGLISTAEELQGFEISNGNSVFLPAKAKIINGNQVEVWSEGISAPKAVRYCFKNYVVGTLANSYGLPASPFRTDK